MAAPRGLLRSPGWITHAGRSCTAAKTAAGQGSEGDGFEGAAAVYVGGSRPHSPESLAAQTDGEKRTKMGPATPEVSRLCVVVLRTGWVFAAGTPASGDRLCAGLQPRSCD